MLLLQRIIPFEVIPTFFEPVERVHLSCRAWCGADSDACARSSAGAIVGLAGGDIFMEMGTASCSVLAAEHT